MKYILDLSSEKRRDTINDETLELLIPYKRARKTWFSSKRAKD